MNIFTTQTFIGEAFLSYQFKVAMILVCFYLFYRLLMSKETFHKLNRFLLTSMLMVSFILPFCVFTIHRYVPAEVAAAKAVSETGKVAMAMPAVSQPIPEFESIEMPAFENEALVQEQAAGVEEVSAPAVPAKNRKPFNWGLFALAIWFAGCVFSLLYRYVG